MVRTLILFAAALVAAAASQVSAVYICGHPQENLRISGDEIATNPKRAGDDYACCNQCSADPSCVAFTEGGTSTDQTCQLFSKVRTLEKTEPYLTFKGYVYQSVFMHGREADNYGKCGDKSGFKGCNAGFYCQPWDANYYQCVTKPAPQCNVETNVDYYGDDLKRVSGLTPGGCCDECSKTAGCAAYTFVNDAPDGRQCYLKRAANDRRPTVGVMSGWISLPVVSPWAQCGDGQKQTGLCQTGYYCQPWDAKYHQCVANPAPQCIVEVGIDYYGSDLKRVTGLTPGSCCDECLKTPGCAAYTFVNDAPDGRQCYLKSGSGGRVAKWGVISGGIVR